MKILISFVKNRPGFSLLSLIWAIIAISTVRPHLYIIGWDNFPSYFNLPTNIFRTFFATWREYRGLGSASDSEVVDIFRQLFYFVLSPVLPEAMLDQVYMLTALAVGLCAMYFFTYLLFKRTLPYANLQLLDIGGFVAAFFYLCNLNTLATFYFPMIMYTNRFFTLPLLFLIFYLLLYKTHIRAWHYVVFAVGIFFAAGSFVTATILITIVIAVFLFGVTQPNKKRFAIIFVFYLLFNTFWLLPFANYTLHKSSIIRLAPNFVTANEIQLNKSANAYQLGKQLTLYHNFFDTAFRDINDDRDLYFNRVQETYKSTLPLLIFWIFPSLYLIATGILVFRYKTYRSLLFLPGILFVFLFLSMKEFSPLGFIYSFLNDQTPYFGVLFRFGDTKFHAFIAFSGSILASFVIVYLLRSWTRVQRYLLIALVILPTLFLFRGYMTGKLIGPFMFTKLPSAYVEIAKIVNNDPENVRILHLPFDSSSYWKSYSWGSFGSSFLHFMFDKPFIDKTFEPASMENAYLHRRINNIVANAQLIRNENDMQKKAAELAVLLRSTGVKYVIVDETVQASLYPRGILLWGDYNTQDVKALFAAMERGGMARATRRFDINLSDYKSSFDGDHSLTKDEESKLFSNSKSTIVLYEVVSAAPLVSFVGESQMVDRDFPNVLEAETSTGQAHLVQNTANKKGDIFPFKRLNATLGKQKDSLSLSFDRSFGTKGVVTFVPGEEDASAKTRYVDIYQYTNEQNIILSFYERMTPTINGNVGSVHIKDITIPLSLFVSLLIDTADLSDYISDWRVLPFQELGQLRLRIGEYMIPLAAKPTAQLSYNGTVAVHDDDLSIEILSYAGRVQLDPNSAIQTDNANCFVDKLPDSAFSLTPGEKGITVKSQNQSTCFFYDISSVLSSDTQHVEVRAVTSGKSKDIDKLLGTLFSPAKPGLRQAVMKLPKPNLLRMCAKEKQIDECYNLHQFANIEGNKTVVFPLERAVGQVKEMVLLFSLKNTGRQQQEIKIGELAIDTFKTIGADTLVLPNVPASSYSFVVDPDTPLSLSFPKALSLYSFFFDPKKEGMYGYNPICDKDKGYRTFRTFEESQLSYVENCYNEIFQDMPFRSDNYYLWSLSYNLFSGKYPRVLVNDGVYHYADELVSLYQGYPDVEGFKYFQNPETWSQRMLGLTSSELIMKKLKEAPSQAAYGYIGPHEELGDTSRKKWIIHQDAENEGLMRIDNFFVQPLPTKWANSRISFNQEKTTYQRPEAYSFKRHLPSLTTVDIESNQKSTYMLYYNEGFDTQWKVYESIFGAVTGFGKSYVPFRCDGFANCYEIVNKEGEKKRLYLFYTPERLAILGWIITLTAIVFFARRFVGAGQVKPQS